MKKLLRGMSYVLVAALASAATFFTVHFVPGNSYSKLTELKALVDEKFIGEIDWKVAEDAAAAGMDRKKLAGAECAREIWSYDYCTERRRKNQCISQRG